MQPECLHLVFFSPAYTTRAYLRYISRGFNCETIEHDMTGPTWNDQPVKIKRNEVVIFGAPAYGGRVPFLAAKRFRLFSSAGAPAIVVAVYGNRDYEDTLLELHNLAQEQGFQVAAAAAMIAQHSLLPHNAAGRPDTADQKIAREFGKKCFAKIIAGAPYSPLSIKGNFPYKLLINSGDPILPYGNDACTGCMTCVYNCPVQAISSADPKKTGKDCFTCGRCMKICPVNARQLDPKAFLLMRERLDELCAAYKEPEISGTKK